MLPILTVVGALTLLVSTCNAKSTAVEPRTSGRENPFRSWYDQDYCNGDFCYNYCVLAYEGYSAYYYDDCWEECDAKITATNIEMARADAVKLLKEVQDRKAPAPACICEDFCKVSEKWGDFENYGDYADYDDCMDKCKNWDDWEIGSWGK